MIILGVILIIIGAVTGISILYTIGAILAVVGLSSPSGVRSVVAWVAARPSS